MIFVAQADLDALFRLHLIDAAMADAKARAAALDPGRAYQAAIKQAETERQAAEAHLKELEDELTQKEAFLKQVEEKTKKVHNELYNSILLSPRDVENLKREMDQLKRQREEADEKVLALWDERPAREQGVTAVLEKIEKLRQGLATHQEKVKAEHARLEATYREKGAKRAEIAQSVPAALLTQYEAIRKRAAGVGMAEITAEKACSGCGMRIPAKAFATVKEGRIAVCESCHRILYIEVVEA